MSNGKILIVDHNRSVASRVADILEQVGYVVRMDHSSTTAPQNAKVFAPSLLIIDPIMPGLSGVEIAVRISKEVKCKVLFLTTLASDSDFREMIRGLRQQGCDCEALPKTFSKEQLLKNVGRRVRQVVIGNSQGHFSDNHSLASEESAQPASEWREGDHVPSLGDYEPLLDLCTLDLYRSNAFRITGLSVDSSSRDISRVTERLEMMIKLDTVPALKGPFPLKEELSVSSVKSALQTLIDPEQRLLHEFFWFWPCAGTSKEDLALRALAEGQYQVAVDRWVSIKAGEGGTAIHNLAVLYHITALEGLAQQSKGSPDVTVQNQEVWTN